LTQLWSPDLAQGADPDLCRRLSGDRGMLGRRYPDGTAASQDRPAEGTGDRAAL